MHYVIEIHDYMFRYNMNYFLVEVPNDLFGNKKDVYDYFSSIMVDFLNKYADEVKPLNEKINDLYYIKNSFNENKKLIDEAFKEIEEIKKKYTKKDLEGFILKDKPEIKFLDFSNISICYEEP